MAVDEFVKLPLDNSLRYELSEGELITLASAAARHEMVTAKIVQILVAYILRNPIGRIFSETSFVLSAPTFRMPDVSFVNHRKLGNYNPEKMFAFAPDLAVEIVSEHDEAVDLETKIDQFLKAGSEAVCVVYMQPKKVYLHEPAGVRVFKEHDTLELPSVLPGFAVPVAEFFD